MLHKIIIRKTNSTGPIFRSNRIVKRVMEGKIEGRIKVMGRRGRRSKQLLGNLKDTKTCCKLKE